LLKKSDISYRNPLWAILKNTTALTTTRRNAKFGIGKNPVIKKKNQIREQITLTET